MKRPVSILLFIVLILANFTYADANFHNTFINIFEKVKDSIASITVTGNSMTPDIKPPKIKGAGFVWTSDGYIISAVHLFPDSIKEIEIIIGKKIFKGRLIGRDGKTDIALLKVDVGEPLKPLQFGDSDQIKIGEWIVAIGDPFGLDNSMTHGIISGKKRNIGMALDEFIQHDAAINPGNSGGPLINLKNEVIGMNTVMAEGNNTGFAVPINLIKTVAAMLKTYGKVTRSRMGVELADSESLSVGTINELNLPLAILTNKNSIIVTNVFSLTPADKAGIKKGDMIRFFNGKKVKNSLELARLIAYSPPYKIVYIAIERQNKLLTLSVKLALCEDKN